MTAQPCAEPGCTGQIEDGYCNVCGAPAPSSAQAAASDPSACTQPGCTGRIEDGYCNVCGTPGPAASGPIASPTGATQSPSASPSGRTASSASPAQSSSLSMKLSSTPIGSARAGLSRPTRRLISASSRVQHLGAGITNVPAVPVTDPQSAVLQDPSIAEDKRFCSSCGSPVGRSRDGKPGRTDGFCPKCRTAYSFAPKLKAGDMVGGQYEVVGCLAHGGLGWIYLARDHNVSDRYVVLKGLLNTGDADAFEAAVAERRFLAEVQHPLILEIYNFANHEGAGYIVMEYVGGESLKQILKNRMVANGGHYDPIPPDQAIAYIIEILPAFAYLHSQGLLYCDFKPDNVIQAGDSLKLIDLGGVRRVDDDQSAIYGTGGYQAPEVATLGPSVASDIFTIGRTLAVLAMEFRGYQTTYAASLPPVSDTPLFQQHDSLYRALSKATAADPDDRFQSADELRDQLLGVLRGVVAVDSGAAAATHSTASSLFGSPTGAGTDLTAADLPALRIDRADPSAAWLAGVSVADGAERLRVLEQAPEDSVEVKLARARAAIDAGVYPLADGIVNMLLTDNPWEWRAVWLSGLSAFTRLDFEGASTAFNTVLSQVPGELAPKLALAVACERNGDHDLAEQLYVVCAATDATYVAPAAFGLARTRQARGDIPGCLEALDLVAPTSGAYVAARRQKADVLTATAPGLAELSQAAASIENVAVDPRDRLDVRVRILTAAITHVQVTGDEPLTTIGGVSAREPDLRLAAEQAYRDLAALTPDRDARVGLVDSANAIRPRTLV